MSVQNARNQILYEYFIMKIKHCRFCLVIFLCIVLAVFAGCQKDKMKYDKKYIHYGTLTDIDGNFYATIKLGQREWMAENLRVTKYNDGKDIQTGLNSAEWFDTKNGAYAIFPHEDIDGLDSADEVIDNYGLHYNWYTVESGNLCPAGWRIPEPGDWEALLWHLIDNNEHIEEENVGSSLKSCRQADSPLGGECNTSEHPRWLPDGVDYFALEMKQVFPELDNLTGPVNTSLYLAGTDEFGFSAHPAGIYIPDFHYGLGYLSKFWTDAKTVQDIPVTSECGQEIISTILTVAHQDINNGPDLYSSFTIIGKGLPVRCVRGEP